MDPRTSAQDVMHCDLCETAVVQMHCDTCLVNLCKACLGEHFSADLSKPHKIVDFKDRNTTPLYPWCTSHDKERCKMYCKSCDKPICIACVASENHSGHKIIQILTLYHDRKRELETGKEEMKKNIYPVYQDIVSDIQKTKSQLDKKYGDLSTAITKHGEDWHREIDKVVTKLKAEVDNMKDKHQNALKEHIDEINQRISDVDEEIRETSKLLVSNDISVVLHFNTRITEFRKIPPTVKATYPHFTPMKCQFLTQFGKLSELSLTSEENGYVMKTAQIPSEAGSSPSVKQLLNEPETVTTINSGHIFIYSYKGCSVACLNDEEIWTSGEESTMKLFSIKQRSQLKSITTKSGNMPKDIAVTQSGDLVYIDYHDRTVNIMKNEKIEEVIRLKNWRPRGVCSTSSGDLVVTMNSDDNEQSKVVRYSDSTEKQSIQFDDKGKPLYLCSGYTKYIAENKNLDICVSDDGARAVVVVNQAGKLRFRYTGHTPVPKNEPFCPRGITTDSQSHILTSDYSNDCVHIIDQDGQFLCYIDCGLRRPCELCIDTNDNLFAAQCRNGQVKKIKYLQ